MLHWCNIFRTFWHYKRNCHAIHLQPTVFENFAIRFRAELKIDTPGIYTFELNSDDGSQLYINGKLVIDNDGIHATVSKQGSIKLDMGIHPVEIHYFQGP